MVGDDAVVFDGLTFGDFFLLVVVDAPISMTTPPPGISVMTLSCSTTMTSGRL